MLVLSRRLNEKIVLPGINTTLQITDIKRGVVRLGIEAPPAVAVFRDEVWQRERHGKAIPELLHDSAAWSRLQELGHLLRNRLNAATIGLALLRRQLQVGLSEPAQQTLERLEREFEGLGGEVRRAVEQGKPRVKPPVRVRKALLVEDDQNERELLAGFLRLAGLDVATAGDGADALDYLRHHDRPDVMLLDMMLPRCDGATTLRAIRGEETFAGLKVFAISGHAPEKFGLEQAGLTVDRWLSKPFNPEVLLRDLAQAFADNP